MTATTTRPARLKLHACSNCGRTDRLLSIAVVEKASGRHTEIELCEQCDEGRFRSCWLRYERTADAG
jgi:hypothetical protein